MLAFQLMRAVGEISLLHRQVFLWGRGQAPIVAAVRLDACALEGRSGCRMWCGGLVGRRLGLNILVGLAS